MSPTKHFECLTISQFRQNHGSDSSVSPMCFGRQCLRHAVVQVVPSQTKEWLGFVAVLFAFEAALLRSVDPNQECHSGCNRPPCIPILGILHPAVGVHTCEPDVIMDVMDGEFVWSTIAPFVGYPVCHESPWQAIFSHPGCKPSPP